MAAGSTITARTELRRKVKVEIPDVGVYEGLPWLCVTIVEHLVAVHSPLSYHAVVLEIS